MTAAPNEKQTRKRGRPPLAEVGMANERVLEVATALFLDLGFGRTTLDLVAQHAMVGKSGLYTRYPNKGALFAAVVERSIQTMFSHMAPVGADLDRAGRLQSVGEILIDGMLHPRCVALMRITAAEAHNFPDLAGTAYQVSFDGAVRNVLQALGHQESPELRRVAERFVEVAVQPLSFQAAFGANVEGLRRKSASCVQDALVLLKARGWLKEEDVI